MKKSKQAMISAAIGMLVCAGVAAPAHAVTTTPKMTKASATSAASVDKDGVVPLRRIEAKAPSGSSLVRYVTPAGMEVGVTGGGTPVLTKKTVQGKPKAMTSYQLDITNPGGVKTDFVADARSVGMTDAEIAGLLLPGQRAAFWASTKHLKSSPAARKAATAASAPEIDSQCGYFGDHGFTNDNKLGAYGCTTRYWNYRGTKFKDIQASMKMSGRRNDWWYHLVKETVWEDTLSSGSYRHDWEPLGNYHPQGCKDMNLSAGGQGGSISVPFTMCPDTINPYLGTDNRTVGAMWEGDSTDVIGNTAVGVYRLTPAAGIAYHFHLYAGEG